MSVSRSSATLKIANWLLARVLLEIFLFCKCSSFPQFDSEMYWALPDGPLPEQGPLGPKWIKLKESEQNQRQKKDLTARSNCIKKQAQLKIIFLGSLYSFADQYLLTVWLIILPWLILYLPPKVKPRRMVAKAWNPVLEGSVPALVPP